MQECAPHVKSKKRLPCLTLPYLMSGKDKTNGCLCTSENRKKSPSSHLAERGEWTQVTGSLSTVILVDKTLTPFHQYETYCHKCGTIVFRIPILVRSYESNLTMVAWRLPDVVYLSMIFILERVCTAVSPDPLNHK